MTRSSSIFSHVADEKGQGKDRFWSSLFWSLLAVTTAIRLLYALKLPLTGDEAYFWEWARHPAMGYYDHPPLAGWILWVSRLFLGDTVAAIRLPAVLGGTLVTVIVFRLAREITGSRRSASLTGILAMGMPVLAVLGVLYSTDAPLLAAGTLAGLFFYKALLTGRTGAWTATGLCLAGAVASKFLAAPLVGGLFLYLILFPPARKHLRTPGPYIAFSMSLAGMLPVLSWNASNSWATFAFNFSSRHAPPEPGIANTLEYIAGQAIGLSPLVLFFGIPLLLGSFLKYRGMKDNHSHLPAFLASIPFLGFFLLSFVTKIGLHWPAIGAPFLAAALGTDMGRRGDPGRRGLWCIGTAWTLSVLIFSLPLAVSFLPEDLDHPLRPGKISTSQLRKYTASPAKTGQAVLAAFEALPREERGFIFTRSYALSSLVAFYTPGHPEVTVLGAGSAHGRNHLLWFNPEDHIGQNAVFVTYRASSREKDFLRERFERWETVLESGGSGGSVVTIVRCYGFNGKR